MHRSKELWMAEALRLGGDNLVEAMIGMSDAIHSLEESMATHARQTADGFNSLRADISLVKSAFINGDLEGHRKAHELQVAELEEKRKLREEKRKLRIAIQTKTITGVIWMALIALAKIIWTGLKQQFGL